jgi:hypothetical protein
VRFYRGRCREDDALGSALVLSAIRKNSMFDLASLQHPANEMRSSTLVCVSLAKSCALFDSRTILMRVAVQCVAIVAVERVHTRARKDDEPTRALDIITCLEAPTASCAMVVIENWSS